MKVKVFNLLQCPFCGGEAKINKTKHYTKESGSSKWEHYVNFYVVFCADCFVKTDDTCTDLKEAVNTWNKRLGSVNQ